MISLQDIKIVARPGYFGKQREQKIREYRKQFGACTQEAWQIGNLILDFSEAVLLYDDAYFNHLNTLPPERINWITSFSECYDSNIQNINCGLEHDERVSPRHIQDVSVRKALIRMGTYFKGWRGWESSLYKEEELLHIRNEGTNGYELMPGRVPFHKPKLILPYEVDNFPKWADVYSIEGFWQLNKVLIV